MPQVDTCTRLVDVFCWIREQPGVFRCEDVCKAFGVSQRTAYRYLSCLSSIDPRLRASAGIGYLYRHPIRVPADTHDFPLTL